MGDWLLRRHRTLRPGSVGVVRITGRATKPVLWGIHGETGG